ncbi:hypothetical protein PROFUN_02035 [Planoprotostelium fungivorum]|uniref:Uncharacterized protein n=1 Tax=Planoprotostelium fungivorum TaxID=1890364 RepID=A0A2P6NB81_9EUKA|nr:hypothetical protein PROFUN_02035 [Planoprotostelium fungivorum]
MESQPPSKRQRQEENEDDEESVDHIVSVLTDYLGRAQEKIRELQEKEEHWKELGQKMQESIAKASQKITLDVGGKRYTTTKDTLLSIENTYFTGMLGSGHWKPDADGSYFIDRDEELFHYVLQLLRTGEMVIDHLSERQRESLRKELEYYLIPLPDQLRPDVSDILSGEHRQRIEQWIGEGKKIGERLYKATEHGFQASVFHTLCDGRGPTVVVVQSDNDSLFGGYAEVSWSSEDTYVASTESFLFALKNPHGITDRFPLNSRDRKYTLNCYAGMGPTFGGRDLVIHDESNTDRSSHCGFPDVYMDTTGKGNLLFTGAHRFQTKEIEVDAHGDPAVTEGVKVAAYLQGNYGEDDDDLDVMMTHVGISPQVISSVQIQCITIDHGDLNVDVNVSLYGREGWNGTVTFISIDLRTGIVDLWIIVKGRLCFFARCRAHLIGFLAYRITKTAKNSAWRAKRETIAWNSWKKIRIEEKMRQLRTKESTMRELEEKVEEHLANVSQRVELNVGGKRYTTSKDTLLSIEDTYFSALLGSGHWKPDADGSYFIDRDGKLFKFVLQLLRTGKMSIDHLSDQQKEDLKGELEYYLIPVEHLPSDLSDILNGEDRKKIEEWLGGGKTLGLRLYKATLHGFKSSDFHQHCDNKGPTVVVIKSVNDSLFGGYAEASWEARGNYVRTTKSFLFALNNPHGPTFGGGHDLCVYSASDENATSYSKFHSFVDTTGKGENLFTGTKHFTTKEIEVYKKNKLGQQKPGFRREGDEQLVANLRDNLKEKAETLRELERKREESNTSQKITLDVGGKRYSTTKDTLLSTKSKYFSNLLGSGCWKPDADGSYFIDRDGKLFKFVLQLLRTGKMSIDHLNKQQRQDLNGELSHYGISLPSGDLSTSFGSLDIQSPSKSSSPSTPGTTSRSPAPVSPFATVGVTPPSFKPAALQFPSTSTTSKSSKPLFSFATPPGATATTPRSSSTTPSPRPAYLPPTSQTTTQSDPALKFDASGILSADHREKIVEWLGEGRKVGERLYKATEHGFRAAQFYKRCEDKNGSIFGSFRNGLFNSSSGGSFLFAMKNPYGITTRLDRFYVWNGSQSHLDLRFGLGSVIHINDDPNFFNIFSREILLSNSYADTTGKGVTLFMGFKSFKPREIEAYKVIF